MFLVCRVIQQFMTQLYSLVWDYLFPPFPSEFCPKKGLLIVKWKPHEAGLIMSCSQRTAPRPRLSGPHWLTTWRSSKTDDLWLAATSLKIGCFPPFFLTPCCYLLCFHIWRNYVFTVNYATLVPFATILCFIVLVTFFLNGVLKFYPCIIMHIYSKISLRKSWKGQNNTFKLRLIHWHY